MTPAFGLIIVGDEILSGKRADKHLAKVIELLAARGLALSYADYVGDDRPRITAALHDIHEDRIELVIIKTTGDAIVDQQ